MNDVEDVIFCGFKSEQQKSVSRLCDSAPIAIGAAGTKKQSKSNQHIGVNLREPKSRATEKRDKLRAEAMTSKTAFSADSKQSNRKAYQGSVILRHSAGTKKQSKSNQHIGVNLREPKSRATGQSCTPQHQLHR